MGFAKRLAELELSADQLLLEMRPGTTVQLLPGGRISRPA